MTSIVDIGKADPGKQMSDALKRRLQKLTRKALLRLWRTARDSTLQVLFWRDLKKECWKLLAKAS